jgi:DNA-binding MarR family transcriptional regulator
MAGDPHPGEDLAWLLSQATHQLDRRLCAVLEPEGLTLGQWRVLRLLADGTGHGMGAVADYAMLPAPTLTKTVDQLVAANLVGRRADLGDRRRVLLHLTARGRRLHARLAGRLSPAATVRQVLDDAEATRLAELLRRLLQRLLPPGPGNTSSSG